jgi:ABC-type transport system substrate-binding protein
MTTFHQALEGPPDDLGCFLGKTERDIRVRWLVADEPSHGAAGTTLNGPWEKDRDDAGGIRLRRSRRWPAEATGNIEEVSLPYQPDGGQVAAQLARGTLQFVPSLTDPGSFAALRSNPDIEVIAAGNISTFFLTFRLDRVDERLRRRITGAIDAHGLAALWPEAAEPATAFVHPRMIGHAWGKQERHEASGKPVEHTLLCPPANTFACTLALEVQRQLHPAGIHLTLAPDPGGYPTWKAMNEAWRAGTGDLLIAGWHQRTPYPDDPQPFLRALFHSKGGANWSGYRQADGHLDFRRPKQAVERIEADAPAVPLVYWTRYSAYRKGIGLELLPGGLPKARLVNVTL